MYGQFNCSILPNYGSTSETISNLELVGEKNHTIECSNLSDIIASNIYLINTNRKDLERYTRTIGTTKDSHELRNNMYSNLLNTNEVVDITTRYINRLSTLVKKTEKRQKLTVDKLMNECEDYLRMYQRVKKQAVKTAREHVLPSELILQNEMEKVRSDEEESSVKEQQFVTKKLEFKKVLILEREEAVKEIENCVIDINKLMKEISTIVHKQSDDINSLENEIEYVCENMESGQRLLEETASYQVRGKKNNTLRLLYISIAAVCGLVTIIVIVT